MEKVKQFKKILKKIGIDGYVVPKNDEFFVNISKIIMID